MKKQLLAILFLCLFTIGFHASAAGVITGTAPAQNSKTKPGRSFVLTYHLISSESEDWSDYCVSPADLEADILYCINNGYTFLRSKDLENPLNQNAKYVLLTFDDGYESDYIHVFPLLEKYKIPAAFFIVGSFVGKAGYLSSEQIKTMSTSAYVEFGNHSYSLHEKSLADLKKLYANTANLTAIIEDYRKTDQLLRQLTGKPCSALSFPYGEYSVALLSSLREEFGNLITFSTEHRYLNLSFITLPAGRINRAHSYQIKYIAG